MIVTCAVPTTVDVKNTACCNVTTCNSTTYLVSFRRIAPAATLNFQASPARWLKTAFSVYTQRAVVISSSCLEITTTCCVITQTNAILNS